MLSRTLATALSLCLFPAAYAIPEWGHPLAAPPTEAPAFTGFDFTGIVALSNCSGSLVRFDDSLGSSKALVLTNGHCVEMLRPGVVLTNKPAIRTFQLLDSSARTVGRIKTERLLYATMTETDAALYELSETYDAIEARLNIPALTLSRQKPGAGTPIEVLSGYWRRGYSCAIEAEIPALREGDWTFTHSLRYSRPGCETIGGTSGSPVLEAGTRTVIAVNNTGNESGKRCTVNNPCEVDESGNITFVKGYSYAQQTYLFYGCRNEEGTIDLAAPECALPKPQGRH